MFTIQSVALVVHVLISLSIVGLVLLQRGKGAEAGAAFGSGASGTVFGARGSANFLSRATAVLATAFFLSSLGLAYLGSQRAPVESLMDVSEAIEDDSPGEELPTLLPSPDDQARGDGLPTLPEPPGAEKAGATGEAGEPAP